MQSIRDLTNVLQRQNQLSKESKALKKDKIRQRKNPSGQKFLRNRASDSDQQQRKYSVFSEDSSSLSNESEDEEIFTSGESGQVLNNGNFSYPLCLSTIVLQISDILLNPKVIDSLKDDQHRKEIIRLIQLCLQEQKCLMYKMPFFVLNFLTSNSLSNQFSRLDFLKMVTRNGRMVNQAFNNKMFLVIMNMVDPGLIEQEKQMGNQDQILVFLKNLYDYNPACFSVSQNLILLTRISLVGFRAMHNRPEISMDVLEIFQYVLKYNDYSSTHNLKNLVLLALTIMVTKDGQTTEAWNIIKDLITIDPDRIVYEILEVLMIGINTFSQNKRAESLEDLKKHGLRQEDQSKEQVQQNIKMILKKEQDLILLNDHSIMKEQLYIKCFNQKQDEFQMDLEEIEQDLISKHQSCLINNFEEVDQHLSMEELICKMECPSFFVDQKQAFQIIDFDSKQLKMFREQKFGHLQKSFLVDRQEFIESLDKHIDRVKKGAVYFLGMTLYGTDIVPECSYSISRLLEIFHQVLQNTANFKLINEIIQSLLSLLQNQQVELTYEWDIIMDMIETLFEFHLKQVIRNKKLKDIDKIFKRAQDLILLNQFHRDQVRLFKLYNLVRLRYMKSETLREMEINQQKTKVLDSQNIKESVIPCPNMVLLSLYIDHILYEEFESLAQIIEDLFVKETNTEVQMLVMDKIKDFYKYNTGLSAQTEQIEQLIILTLAEVLKNKLTSSAMIIIHENHQSLQEKGLNTAQNLKIQFKAVDLLSLICHETSSQSVFDQACGILHKACVSEHLWIHPVFFMKLGPQAKQGDYKSLFKEMNVLVAHILKRLIQVFKIKLTSLESNKSASILNIFFELIKHEILDMRKLLFKEILQHFVFNSRGLLCWMTKDFPVMIAIKEFYQINSCKQCQLFELEDEAFYADSHRMSISIQMLLDTLIFQQALGNDNALSFKLSCLTKIKSLLIDLHIAEENLHQVMAQSVKDHFPLVSKLDLDLVAKLVDHVDLELNFDCSLQIQEIMTIVVGFISINNNKIEQAGLTLSPEVQEKLFQMVNRCISQSYLKFVSISKPDHRQSMHSTAHENFFQDINDSHDMLRQSVHFAQKSDINGVSQREISMLCDQSNFSLNVIQLKQMHNQEFLTCCRQSLHLLSVFLKSDLKFWFRKSSEGEGQYFELEPAKGKVMQQIIETLCMLCLSDSTLHLFTVQIKELLESLVDLFIQLNIRESTCLGIVFLLIFRLCIPKILSIPRDYDQLHKKGQTKKNSQFLKMILTHNVVSQDSQSNIVSYQDCVQFQTILGQLGGSVNKLFEMNSKFEVFDVLQNFFLKVIAQFDYWISNQEMKESFQNCVQLMFFHNLACKIHWTFNSKKGALRKHLSFSRVNPSQDQEFFLINRNLVQVNKVGIEESSQQSYILQIRNSAYNFETKLSVQNPSMEAVSKSIVENKNQMRNLLQIDSQNSQNKFSSELNQEIMLQVMHPQDLNKMKKENAMSQILVSQRPKCKELIEKLDKLAPYNVHLVFVSCYFSDRETSFDLLSRLGNFCELNCYSHYLQSFNSDDSSYLQKQKAVVFDQDLDSVYIFLSDILCEPKNPIDFEILQGIKGLTTIFMNSLFSLDLKAIDFYKPDQVKKFHKFISNEYNLINSERQIEPIKIFLLNHRSYAVSSQLKAVGHENMFDLSEEGECNDVFESILEKVTKEMQEEGQIPKENNMRKLFNFDRNIESQTKEASYNANPAVSNLIQQNSNNQESVPTEPSSRQPRMHSFSLPQTQANYISEQIQFVQQEQIGEMTRNLVLRRKLFTSQFEEMAQTPCSLKREQLINRFIIEVSHPKN